MRRAVIAALVLLAGCQKSFDERYADAEKEVREQAASIDKDLADRASEAALAEPEEPEGTATPVPASDPAEPLRRIPRP